MAYRFLGMDPYLEDPAIWRGFHHRLADEIADTLNPEIGPKYYADIDVHTLFEEIHVGKAKPIIPDVAIVSQPFAFAGGRRHRCRRCRTNRSVGPRAADGQGDAGDVARRSYFYHRNR
jgi:hypothetical protein